MSIATRKSDGAQAGKDLSAVGLARRQLLQKAGLMLGALTMASGASAAACSSPDDNDSSLRKSLHYVESSPNPDQHCSGCSFFSASQGSCGRCMIFDGPANINGHCDSWAARS